MGKRKKSAASKQPSRKKQQKLETVFDCPFCSHPQSVECVMWVTDSCFFTSSQILWIYILTFNILWYMTGSKYQLFMHVSIAIGIESKWSENSVAGCAQLPTPWQSSVSLHVINYSPLCSNQNSFLIITLVWIWANQSCSLLSINVLRFERGDWRVRLQWPDENKLYLI